MEDLSKKFERELFEDANVVACRFNIKNWTPIKSFGIGTDKVWLYSFPKSTKVAQT